MDIYSRIWEADQSQGNGIQALALGESKDRDRGYIFVDESGNSSDRDHMVLKDLYIPDSKLKTYQLCLALFDNFTLCDADLEVITPEETREVELFLEYVMDLPPMCIAREYISQIRGQDISLPRWYQMLYDVWFRRFSNSSSDGLSGFEHVFVGDVSRRGKLGGHHFWYKYYLDESTTYLDRDDIVYSGTAYRGPNASKAVYVPDVVTLSYKYTGYDYERGRSVSVRKPVGGFWVGCSPEALMALGMVRFQRDKSAPSMATINGILYDLKLFRSRDNVSIRTFYPVFVDVVEGQALPPMKEEREDSRDVVRLDLPKVKISAALVNPSGEDQGQELIVLTNLLGDRVDLNDFYLSNGRGRYELSGLFIDPFQTINVILPKEFFLPNSGGSLSLLTRTDELIDRVSYQRDMVRSGMLMSF